MEKVMTDMKARPAIRADRDWDLTEKVSREGRVILKDIVNKAQITRRKPED